MWGAKEKGFSTLGKHISLKISEKKEKEEENQGQGASMTNFVNVLRLSSFILHPVSDCFKDLTLIYGP